MDLDREVLAAAEGAADAGEVDPNPFGLEVEAGRDLVAIDVEPLGCDVDVDAALPVGDRDPRLRAQERLILRADLVDARHHDLTFHAGIAVRDLDVPQDVRPRVVAIAVTRGRPAFVERDGFGCPLHVRDDGERLVLDDDRLGGTTRLLGMVGGNQRDRLTVIAHAIDREHRLIGELEPVRLRAGNIGVGQDGMHPGEQEGRAEVDRDDARVRMRAAQRPSPEHPRLIEIARVRERAGHLGDAVRAAGLDLRAPSLQRARAHASAALRTASKIRPYPVHRQTFPESASRISSSLGEGDAIEEVDRGDDEAGRAEAALHRARLDERLLHAVEPPVDGDPLHGHELAPVGLRPENEAGTDELPVEQDGARATFSLLTGVLRAGEPEPLAEHVEQALAAPHVGLVPVAVDRELDLHAARHLPSARVGKHAERVAPIGRGATDIVDRTRSSDHALGDRVGLCERHPDQRRYRCRRAERGANLSAFAVHLESERADGDHHRVARSHLHEGLRRGARCEPDRRDELVVLERVALDPEEERLERKRPSSAHACDLDAAPPRREAGGARRPRARRCRGCRRSCRGCGSAASRPCARPWQGPGKRLASSGSIASV